MNVAIFLQTFPEFAETSPALIQAKLAEASASMGMNGTGGGQLAWGCFASLGQPITTADVAHGNLAADLLISSPLGASTLLVSQNNGKPSYYRKRYLELEQSIFPLCVAGGSGYGRGPW